MADYRWGLACWGLRETPLDGQLAMAKRLGMSLLELGIGGHGNDFIQLDATPERLAECRAKFAAAGVVLECGSTGNDFTAADPAAVAASVESVKNAIRLGSLLGVKMLRIFAGFSPVAEVTQDRWRRQVAALREVYLYGAGYGVLPVVETHGGVEGRPGGECHHTMSTSTSMEAVKRMAGEVPGLRLNYDPANLVAAGVEPVGFLREFRKIVAYCHLKDFVNRPGTDAWRPAACGEGGMDWGAIFGVLGEFGGPMLFEYEVPADVEDGFRRSLTYIQKIKK